MQAPTRGIQPETVENIQSLLPGQLINSFPQLFDELTQEVKQMYYNSMKRVTSMWILNQLSLAHYTTIAVLYEILIAIRYIVL